MESDLESDSSNGATCSACGASFVELPYVHVKRHCAECGKVKHIPRVAGEKLVTEEGDDLVVPSSWLRMSLRSRETKGRFYRGGMTWFVQQLIFNGAVQSEGTLAESLASYTAEADAVLAASELLQGLDLENEADCERGRAILQGRQDTKEWWATIVGMLSKEVAAALEAQDAATAAWRMNQLTNAHAMLVYTRDVEPLAWRGYRLSELSRVLDIWQQNQGNSSEEFWQRLFSQHSFVLAQIFALPLVIIQEKAYLGGKGISNAGGKLVDFLVQNKLTQNVGLIEIKTPPTPLVGKEYRNGCYSMSPDFSGAVVQVAHYKDTLLKGYSQLCLQSGPSFDAFEPECVVIAGNYTAELEKRASFELFRANLRYVRIVTFDELFQKVATLLSLLGEQEVGSDPEQG
jgi:Domain of unknown function (DUF4263)